MTEATAQTARKAVVYVETCEGVEISSGIPRDYETGKEWTVELEETRLRRIGTTFFAHVRVEWETSLGTVHSVCHTAERSESIAQIDRVPPIGQNAKKRRRIFSLPGARFADRRVR
jgi:hypothetical protein